jgi:hypothetical protein
MKLNERGSSLVNVLLVIIVFSVLGFALMGNVLSENKRTNTTEANMQARYLAESGLTYFEADFRHFIKNPPKETIDFQGLPKDLNDFFLNKYLDDGEVVQTEPEKITVMVEWVDKSGIRITNFDKSYIKDKINDLRIKVTSIGTIGSNTETLIAYYKPGIDIDKYTARFPDFTVDGLAVDFAKKNALGLELLSLLNVEVIDTKGDDETFYVVPSHSLIGVSALDDLISVNLLEANRFKMMEQNSVIATRQGRLVGVDLNLDIFSGMRTAQLKINVLKLRDSYDTNVLIDGSYDQGIKILGIDLTEKKYKDINFKKLAVLGNVIIKQDRVADGSKDFDSENLRSFAFQNGLYVNRSLAIGGKETGLKGNQVYKGNGNLGLKGNMLIMDDLYISDTNVLFGAGDNSLPSHERYSNLYVYGDVTIKETACVNKGNPVRIFSKGKITIENNGGYSEQCNEYNGLFYAEKGIEINTKGKKMKIRGRLIGDVKVLNNQVGNLEYPNTSPEDIYQIILKNLTLTPLGRTFQK